MYIFVNKTGILGTPKSIFVCIAQIYTPSLAAVYTPAKGKNGQWPIVRFNRIHK